jgi:hypothetical protein
MMLSVEERKDSAWCVCKVEWTFKVCLGSLSVLLNHKTYFASLQSGTTDDKYKLGRYKKKKAVSVSALHVSPTKIPNASGGGGGGGGGAGTSDQTQ